MSAQENDTLDSPPSKQEMLQSEAKNEDDSTEEREVLTSKTSQSTTTTASPSRPRRLSTASLTSLRQRFFSHKPPNNENNDDAVSVRSCDLTEEISNNHQHQQKGNILKRVASAVSISSTLSLPIVPQYAYEQNSRKLYKQASAEARDDTLAQYYHAQALACGYMF